MQVEKPYLMKPDQSDGFFCQRSERTYLARKTEARIM